MLKLKHITLSFIILAAPAFTANAASSPESIKKFLAVTNVRKSVEGQFVQMEQAMKSGIQQTLQTQQVSASEKKIIEDMQSKMISALKEGQNWDKLEPMLVKVYSEAFTQDETDAILAFYETPAGEAMLRKMPEVSQKSMMEIRTYMTPMMEKIQKIQQDAASKMEAQQPKGKK